MRRIDTLKAYEELLKVGILPEQARIQVDLIDHSFNEILKEFKGEFASNKMVAIMGSIIIAIGSFTLTKVIDLDKRVAILENTIVQIKSE